METLWRIEMFGGLRAVQGEQVITRFRSHKTGALLAYLAFYPHRSHPRDLLTDLLWPDDPLDTARMKLRTALASLRRQLEPPGVPAGAVLVASRLAVRLNPDAVMTDVLQFEAALQTAERATAVDQQLSALDQAISLYRGPLLPGYYESWILPEQQRLSGLYLQALQRAVTSLESAGDRDRALAYAGRAVALEPLREETHRELIRLLVSTGQPAAARQQYHELERLLREELGEAPSPSTRALADARLDAGAVPLRLVRGVGAAPKGSSPESGTDPVRADSAAPSVAPPPDPSAPAPPHLHPPRLPLPLTRFFGREAELARLRKLLVTEGTRLVTLTGPGGSGKTRLALEAAALLREPLDGAVWFVPLADVADPQRIHDAIHVALALPRLPQKVPREQIVEALSARPALLVLDNLEHLMPAACPVVRDLLAEIPLLQCLVTSRQILELTPEREIAVGPLPVPGAQAFRRGTRAVGDEVLEETSEALNARTPERLNVLLTNESIALFVDRAQRAMPDFQLTSANAGAVAELCRRLEGIPLAIELAAARAKQLSPARMVAQLERRFDLLVSRKRDLPSRHQTLRATIDWSYHRLSPELRRFFVQLFPFRGGCTVEASKAVSEQPNASRYLEQLRDCSLVVMQGGPELRCRLLETLQVYAAEQLSMEERIDVARRHAEHFLALADAAAAELGGPNSPAWLDRLEREHDDLRAALEWFAGTGAAEAGCRLGAILSRFWSARGYVREGRERLATLLALPQAAGTVVGAAVLTKAGGLAYLQGDYADADALLQEGLAIARRVGSSTGMIEALHHLADIALARYDNAAARACYEEYLGIAREAGNQWSVATGLTGLGVLAEREGNLDAAQALYEESVTILWEIGAKQPLANALNNLGSVARDRGDYATARMILEQALAIGREQNNKIVIANELYSLGLLAQRQSTAAEARAFYNECLAISQEIGYQSHIERCLSQLEKLASLPPYP